MIFCNERKGNIEGKRRFIIQYTVFVGLDSRTCVGCEQIR